ncbi:MAG: CRISPR-associated endonuclease Cas3'', partial [Opitutales bacterium]|nr:CRISPR-associated endonuclease Cas3'' [Opitutales bacterium]
MPVLGSWLVDYGKTRDEKNAKTLDEILMGVVPDYFRYWGKAKPGENGGASYHLLPYHCLDVAAVAACWWKRSPAISGQFTRITGLPEEQARAWVLFFIALHDYGKFDIRFQLKARSAWQDLNTDVVG